MTSEDQIIGETSSILDQIVDGFVANLLDKLQDVSLSDFFLFETGLPFPRIFKKSLDIIDALLTGLQQTVLVLVLGWIGRVAAPAPPQTFETSVCSRADAVRFVQQQLIAGISEFAADPFTAGTNLTALAWAERFERTGRIRQILTRPIGFLMEQFSRVGLLDRFWKYVLRTLTTILTIAWSIGAMLLLVVLLRKMGSPAFPRFRQNKLRRRFTGPYRTREVP